MALIFSTVFAGGVFGDFNFTTPLHDTFGAPSGGRIQQFLGCNGGYAVSCAVAGFAKRLLDTDTHVYFPPSYPTDPALHFPTNVPTSTVRLQYACLNTYGGGFIGPSSLQYNDIYDFQGGWYKDGFAAPGVPYGPTLSSVQMTGGLDLRGTGALRLTFNTPGTVTHYESAAGVFPMDGTMQCVEITLDVSTTQCLFEVFVAGVSVLSGTHVQAYGEGALAGFYGYPTPRLGPTLINPFGFWNVSPSIAISALASIEVEDTINPNATVCNAAPLFYNGAFNNSCLVLPAVTTLTVTKSAPTDPSAVFDFTISPDPVIGPTAFSLRDGEFYTFAFIPAGTYSIQETAPVGWDPPQYVVSNGNPHGAVVIADFEQVTVAVTNTQEVPPPPPPPPVPPPSCLIGVSSCDPQRSGPRQGV